MNLLFVTPELAPWVKTGGLGDVAGALPGAIKALGVDIRVLLPAYPELLRKFPEAKEVALPSWPDGLLPLPSLKLATTADGIPLYLLDYASYYDREGNPYLGPDGEDWTDNHLRFALLSRVAAWLGSTSNTWTGKPTSSIATTGKPG